MSKQCSCICRCPFDREDGCNDLCAECWQAWSAPLEADSEHAPIADRSFLAAYGIANVWAWWIANQGAGHLLARPFGDLHHVGDVPVCPESVVEPHKMIRRPGGWKCYRHEQAVVLMDEYAIPPTPTARPIR